MASFRTIAETAVAILAILAMAADLHEDHPDKLPAAPARHAGSSLEAELHRCQLLGKAALDDTTCAAAWAENRRRFFGSQRKAGPGTSATKEVRAP